MAFFVLPAAPAAERTLKFMKIHWFLWDATHVRRFRAQARTEEQISKIDKQEETTCAEQRTKQRNGTGYDAIRQSSQLANHTVLVRLA